MNRQFPRLSAQRQATPDQFKGDLRVVFELVVVQADLFQECCPVKGSVHRYQASAATLGISASTSALMSSGRDCSSLGRTTTYRGDSGSSGCSCASSTS